MINLSEIQSQEINEIIKDYQARGGVLHMFVYKIEANDRKQLPQDEYWAHLVVARQTIDKINYQCNFHWNKVAYQNARNSYPVYLTDYDKLDASGKKRDPGNSLGSFYALKVDNLNQFTGDFANAFLYPPYGMGLGNDVNLIQTYLIEFTDFFFGKLDKIQVYSWDTDCSAFFDDGKEWWGCYFWTVYNPIKDWYVGIAGSTTD